MSHSMHPSSDSPSGVARRLLTEVQAGGQAQIGPLLQLYRNYLTVLATAQLEPKIRRRVSPSDLVQEALLGAYRDFADFRGGTEREFLAWLRQILIHCLHRAYDRHRAGRRDVRREMSFEEFDQSLDRSAARMADVFADQGVSPSAAVSRHERVLELSDRLAQLRPDYREVIILRNLQELPFEEVAERMDRKPGAVRMLWLRAMESFRQKFEAAE